MVCNETAASFSLTKLGTMKSFLASFLVLFFVITFVACGGSGSETETTTSSETEELSSESASTELMIRPVGNEMKYEVETLTVAAGTEVTLTLENIATSPVMIHNVVILKTNNDEDVTRIGIAAITAGEENGYLPEDDAIFAATPMAQPGETVQVTFTAPSEPGTHRFICTYPGHFGVMQGVLVVT